MLPYEKKYMLKNSIISKLQIKFAIKMDKLSLKKTKVKEIKTVIKKLHWTIKVK